MENKNKQFENRIEVNIVLVTIILNEIEFWYIQTTPQFYTTKSKEIDIFQIDY